MRLRKQELGDRNLVGSRVEAVRKQKGMKQKELLAQLQVNGVDMNASGLSKLEGQIRFVTDVELVALADILEVSVDYLLGRENWFLTESLNCTVDFFCGAFISRQNRWYKKNNRSSNRGDECDWPQQHWKIQRKQSNRGQKGNRRIT